MSEETTTTTTGGMVDAGAAAATTEAAAPKDAGVGTLLSNPPADKTADKTTEETGKPEGTTQTEEDAKPNGAPEKYEFKAPEGLELNSELVEEFTPIAKELNLSNEQAQKLVDKFGSLILNIHKTSNEAWQNTMTSWTNSVKADKEIGGAELASCVTAANNSIDRFGTPEFRKVLDPPSPKNPGGLALGNHPEVIRYLARVGKAMGEDQTYLQAQTPTKPVERAKTLFPGMN